MSDAQNSASAARQVDRHVRTQPAPQPVGEQPATTGPRAGG